MAGVNGRLDTQARSGSVRAVQDDAAAERLCPVLEAEKACSAGEVGTSYAVVTHLQPQDGVGGLLV